MAPLNYKNLVILGLVLILNHKSMQINAQISAESPPKIYSFGNKVHKNHHVLLEDDPISRISFDCEVRGFPTPEIKWFKDDVVIEDGSISGLSFLDSQIQFQEPNLVNHVGYYHCEAENKWGKAKSEVLYVSTQEPSYDDWMTPPSFKVSPETTLPVIDSTAELKCEADGSPRPKIEWTRNGEILEEFNDKEKLTIKGMKESDIGSYACNASNIAGYDYITVQVNIFSQKPIFTERPSSTKKSVGTEAILRCSVKGYPKPEITWYFENKEITNDSDEYTITGTGDLKINKITMDQNNGQYECRASNENGENSAFANLTVVDKTTILHGPSDMTAKVTSTVKMNCTVLSDPNFGALEVTWKKDNRRLHVDGEKIIMNPEDNSLTIKDLTFGDAGVYTCAAETPLHQDTDSGTLTVVGIPPKITEGPAEMTVKEGTDIELLCKVTKSYPLPKFTWYKDEIGERLPVRVPLDHRVYMNKETGTLTILDSRESDSAKYMCVAKNEEGQDKRSAFVDIRKGSTIRKQPEHMIFQEGVNVTFDCGVEVDERLLEQTTIEWLFQRFDSENKEKLYYDTEHTTTPETGSTPSRFFMMSNYTLHISDTSENDLGVYTCIVNSGIDTKELSATLYQEKPLDWLHILIIIIICILIIAITIMCIVCVRKRSRKQGKYGVKDVTDGKKRHNKSDILYSIDDDTESLQKDDPEAGTNHAPIIKPSKNPKNYNSQISNSSVGYATDLLKGSENSLLNMTDEDMWLRKGMDEDGSFRQVYIKE